MDRKEVVVRWAPVDQLPGYEGATPSGATRLVVDRENLVSTKMRIKSVYCLAPSAQEWLDSLAGRDLQELIEMVNDRMDLVGAVGDEYYSVCGILRDWIEDHGGQREWDVVGWY